MRRACVHDRVCHCFLYRVCVFFTTLAGLGSGRRRGAGGGVGSQGEAEEADCAADQPSETGGSGGFVFRSVEFLYKYVYQEMSVFFFFATISFLVGLVGVGIQIF